MQNKLAPVNTILWKNLSQREATKYNTDEVSHISLTNYNNGKLSLCQSQFVHNGLFYLIDFKAFFLISLLQCNCIVVMQALLFTYEKRMFFWFWNNLFKNLISPCIVIVYRLQQQFNSCFDDWFTFWFKEKEKKNPCKTCFPWVCHYTRNIEVFFLEIEWIK